MLDGKVYIKQHEVNTFIIKNKQCIECIRESTDHTWGAQIQLRQYVGHKRTFFELESLLTKNNLHHLMLDVSVVKEGVDFYFKTKNLSDKVTEFVTSHLPVRLKHSKVIL